MCRQHKRMQTQTIVKGKQEYAKLMANSRNTSINIVHINFDFRKRVLKLELTDGHRTVYGMEYTPIACLHTKLPPGTKLLLSGPMRCVNHILFLESKNVKLLGGEVVSLLIENALENVLLRELKQPLNPKPKTDYTGKLFV